jgi:hypothetical protein
MNIDWINDAIFQEDSDETNHLEYHVNDNRRWDGIGDMAVVASKLISKWQSLNAQYHLKGANMNDDNSSE